MMHMALTVSVVQPYSACFSGKRLQSAIVLEAVRGYQNILGRKMRFNNFLLSKISRICSRSKHKFAEKLLEEVDRYDSACISDRSKLLNKVSVLMGYNSLDDLIENERSEKKTGSNIRDAIDDFDVTLACKRFPSIILGSSPPVELYAGSTSCSETNNLLAGQSCHEFLGNSMGAKWVVPNSVGEMWPSLIPSLPNVNSSLSVEKNSYTSSPPSPILKVEEKSDQPDSSARLFLDTSINCVPGLSKRHCRQLESCGFHTLRKLLHHFPRTYADLQNAQIGIDDGQYFIFIGKILSSRGVKVSYSFSFLEVVVGCEVAENELTSDRAIDDFHNKGKKIIYLHLKKFFRGTRFTAIPFLKRLREKNKEGEIVCVSGKVEDYTDADCARSMIDRRSILGYCAFVGGNLVTWRSKKQNIVARSAEAEFRSLARGICEVLWLKRLLEDLKVSPSSPMRVYYDNKAPISTAHNSVLHDKAKHIEIYS